MKGNQVANPSRGKVCPEKGQIISIQLETIASWDGNSPDFAHRDGGAPDSGKYWKDLFTSSNPSLPVCFLKQPFFAQAGVYTLSWDADLIFANPACRSAQSNRPAMQTNIFPANAPVSDTYHSQAYVCANRDGLIYNLGINIQFRLPSDDQIDFSLYVYDDRMAGTIGTNIKEVIVKSAVLFKNH